MFHDTNQTLVFDSNGAENKAFDPSPEANLHGEFHNLPPDFARRAEHNFDQNGFSSFDEEEDEESVTPRASPSDYVLHEGRSTFYYGDSKEEDDTKGEAEKDTISTSSTQKLEDALEDKQEEDVFEDATLKLEENGKTSTTTNSTS